MVGRRALVAAWLVVVACDEAPPPIQAPGSPTPSSDASVAPPHTGAMSVPFSQTAVDQVVAAHRPATLRACLAAAPDGLPSSVELVFEVGADGSVDDVAVMGGGASARPVRQCIEGRARGWSFSPPPEATTATASLAL